MADIDWIEGAGVYVNLHAGGQELFYRAALNELAERLDPMRFIRAHRSAIVDIDSILELLSISHGEFEVVLKNGHCPESAVPIEETGTERSSLANPDPMSLPQRSSFRERYYQR